MLSRPAPERGVGHAAAFFRPTAEISFRELDRDLMMTIVGFGVGPMIARQPDLTDIGIVLRDTTEFFMEPPQHCSLRGLSWTQDPFSISERSAAPRIFTCRAQSALGSVPGR